MQEKTISLNDLVNEPVQNKTIPTPKNNIEQPTHSLDGDSQSMKVVNPTDIKPMRKEIDAAKDFERREYDLIDENIERTKREIYRDRIEPYINKCKELAEEAEFNGEVDPTTMADLVSHGTTPVEHMEPEIPVVVKKEPIPTPKTPNFNDSPKPVVKKEPVKEEEVVSAPVEDVIEKKDPIEDIEVSSIDDDKSESVNDDSLDGLDNVKDKTEITETSESNADQDFDSLDDETKKLLLQKSQSNIRKAIKSDFSEIDIDSYSITNSPMSVNKAMNFVIKNNAKFTQSRAVVLLNSGRTMDLTPLTGQEIPKLSDKYYSSSLDYYKKSFAIIYQHDVTPNKPMSFTAWMKSIDIGDLQQIYFGLYASTFADSNYISYEKPISKEVIMKLVPINDMWKFTETATDGQKKRYETINKHGEVESTLKKINLPISKNYLLVLRPRTLYSHIEQLYLDEEFIKKYPEACELSVFVDKAYFIDSKRKMLRPIDFKPDRDSYVKTMKNKCLVLYKIISSITPDEYGMLLGRVQSFDIDSGRMASCISYRIPELKDVEDEFINGPQKGEKTLSTIHETPIDSHSLLFTRHQLAMQSTLHLG